MSIAWRFPKDPTDVAPYSVDWRGLIPADDDILTATWSPSPGDLVVGDFHNVDRITSAVLSGGSVGTYTITLTVTTVNGYTFQREIILTVANL